MTTIWTKITKRTIGKGVLSDDTLALADDPMALAGGLGTQSAWSKQNKS